MKKIVSGIMAVIGFIAYFTLTCIWPVPTLIGTIAFMVGDLNGTWRTLDGLSKMRSPVQ